MILEVILKLLLSKLLVFIAVVEVLLVSLAIAIVSKSIIDTFSLFMHGRVNTAIEYTLFDYICYIFYVKVVVDLTDAQFLLTTLITTTTVMIVLIYHLRDMFFVAGSENHYYCSSCDFYSPFISSYFYFYIFLLPSSLTPFSQSIMSC